MATIPSYKEQTRITQGSPVAVGGTTDARAQGEAIANLGSHISNVAEAASQYNKEKNRIDDALFESDFKTQAVLKMQAATVYARTNENAAPDGSSAQADFGSQIKGMRESVDKIDDGYRRKLALDILNKTESSYRNQLTGFQITKHNQFVLEKFHDIVDQSGARVKNDPSQISEVMQDIDKAAGVIASSYSGANGPTIIHTARRDVVLSAIHGYSENGDFKTARKLVEAGGGFLSEKERHGLVIELHNQEILKKTNDFRDEHYAIVRQERAQKDQEDDMTLQLATIQSTLDNDETRSAFQDDVRIRAKNGLIRPKVAIALLNQSDKESSQQIMNDYMLRHVNGESVGTMKNEMIEDMGPGGGLNPKDGFRMMDMFKTAEKKAAVSPIAKEEQKQANALIDAAVSPFGRSYGRPDSKILTVQVKQRAFELEQQGTKPIDAARQASAEVIGPQALRDLDRNLPRTTGNISADVAAAEKYKKDLLDNYTKNKARLTDFQTRQVLEKVQNAHMLIEAINQQQILESITKGSGKK